MQTDVGRLNAMGLAVYLLIIVLLVAEPLLYVLSWLIAFLTELPIAIEPWPHSYTLLALGGFIVYMVLSLFLSVRYGRRR